MICRKSFRLNPLESTSTLSCSHLILVSSDDLRRHALLTAIGRLLFRAFIHSFSVSITLRHRLLSFTMRFTSFLPCNSCVSVLLNSYRCAPFFTPRLRLLSFLIRVITLFPLWFLFPYLVHVHVPSLLSPHILHSLASGYLRRPHIVRLVSRRWFFPAILSDVVFYSPC